jgi:3-oxoadipate enol-lactonase
MAQAMAERIPGAQLTVLPQASHLSVAECPDEFLALVQNWLQS